MLDMTEDGVAQALDIGLGGMGDQQARTEVAQTFHKGAHQYGGAAEQQVAAQPFPAAQPVDPAHEKCRQVKRLGANDRVDGDTNDLRGQKTEQNGGKGR